MNIDELSDADWKKLMIGLGQELSDEHRAVAETLADLLLVLGEAAEDPVVRPYLIDAVLAAVPDAGDKARVLWQSQRPVLAASIAEGQGVPFELIRAESRQRLAIRDLKAVSIDVATEAEAERIRLARESGWCTEFECRSRPTDCADIGMCCWHCGRGHRSAFSAAEAAAEAADED